MLLKYKICEKKNCPAVISLALDHAICDEQTWKGINAMNQFCAVLSMIKFSKFSPKHLRMFLYTILCYTVCSAQIYVEISWLS